MGVTTVFRELTPLPLKQLRLGRSDRVAHSYRSDPYYRGSNAYCSGGQDRTSIALVRVASAEAVTTVVGVAHLWSRSDHHSSLDRACQLRCPESTTARPTSIARGTAKASIAGLCTIIASGRPYVQMYERSTVRTIVRVAPPAPLAYPTPCPQVCHMDDRFLQSARGRNNMANCLVAALKNT